MLNSSSKMNVLYYIYGLIESFSLDVIIATNFLYYINNLSVQAYNLLLILKHNNLFFYQILIAYLFSKTNLFIYIVDLY
jgi:hypothetical protein